MACSTALRDLFLNGVRLSSRTSVLSPYPYRDSTDVRRGCTGDVRMMYGGMYAVTSCYVLPHKKHLLMMRKTDDAFGPTAQGSFSRGRETRCRIRAGHRPL